MKKKKKLLPRKTLFTKNRTTKTLSKKYDKFPVNFQIVLSIHKLYCQNNNYIYKIKAQNFFFAKKKHHRTREARVMRLVFIKGFGIFQKHIYLVIYFIFIKIVLKFC